MVDENQTSNQVVNEENKTTKKAYGFLSGMETFFFFLVIASTMLWNWDGFWQTDIKHLEKFQKEYFSSKHSEEQLKLSRINDNNKLIEYTLGQSDKIKKNAEAKVKKADEEKKEALSTLDNLEIKLRESSEKKRTQCRYFNTSLRMIKILTKKHSEDEIKRVLKCTDPECEKILASFQEASLISICD